jgi:hypothetical protein
MAKLSIKSEHIWYTSYYKSKTTIESSIHYHTLICAIKPSYSSTKNIQFHSH